MTAPDLRRRVTFQRRRVSSTTVGKRFAAIEYRQYNQLVPQNAPIVIITWGFAIQLFGVVAAYQYVTDGSASAPFIWAPAGIGFLVTLTGAVIWRRRNAAKMGRLAGWLLLVGGFTFGIAALGHALGVFFLFAIPTLLLSGGVALVASLLNRSRNHGGSASA